MRRIIKIAIVAFPLVLVSPFLTLYTIIMVKSVPPFPGHNEPENNLERMRQIPEVDRFYDMYDQYGIKANNRSERLSTILWSSSNEAGRDAYLEVSYLLGIPAWFTHVCSEGGTLREISENGTNTHSGHTRVFMEHTVSRNCFEAP